MDSDFCLEETDLCLRKADFCLEKTDFCFFCLGKTDLFSGDESLGYFELELNTMISIIR